MTAETSPSALIVVAHPDDCEFACGGSVAKWARAGTDVKLVVVTDGCLGSHDTAISDEELARIRENEQRQAAEVLGLRDVRFFGVRDGSARADEELVGRLVCEIRAVRPGRLVTHDPWKQYMLHPDHLEVGRAVVLAAVRAREPRVKMGVGLCEWRPDELWLFRAQAPDHIEDTSETHDQQTRALLCHRSQYSTSMGFECGDGGGRALFLSRFERAAAETGRLAGYARGETFRRILL
jgi:LmbE family N-acetylglucosaminyl deacetylase